MICLVTDRHLVEPGSLERAVSAAVAGGVTLVQLREKDLPTRPLLELALRLREALGERARLVINTYADVAFATKADGVHLPSDGLPPEGARAVLGPEALIGQSIHSIEEAARYQQADLDYLELGTIFPSRSHPGYPTLGVDAIREAAQYRLPIVAVGGITPENVGSVIEAGAAGVAVISAILAAPDPRDAARRLCEAAQEGWERRDLAARGEPVEPQARHPSTRSG